jgi:1-deoxyxylulose-5-phosphate synthase
MKYCKLGRSGLTVSRLALGCMSYGDGRTRRWTLGIEDARRHVRLALDAGINFFDTANSYSDGVSEEIIGQLLCAMARRDEVVIATKVCSPTGPGPNRRGLGRKHVIDACEQSLRRLGTDFIDLYQIHRWDESTPIEETLDALDQLVRSGKVRYLGASSMAAWQFAKALHAARHHGWHGFVSMQNHYNLVYREEEREMIPLCEDEGVAVLPWSPVARGFLEHRPPGAAQERDTLRARTDEVGRQLYGKPGDLAVASAAQELARERGLTPSQLALAWVLQAPAVASPIIGATRDEHLQQLLQAVSIRLDSDEVARLEQAYEPHSVAGHTQPRATRRVPEFPLGP